MAGPDRTGAHDVPSAGRLLRDLGGEPPAFPHVRKYVQPGEAADHLAGSRERLGDRSSASGHSDAVDWSPVIATFIRAVTSRDSRCRLG
jgi:hypothetical protein